MSDQEADKTKEAPKPNDAANIAAIEAKANEAIEKANAAAKAATDKVKEIESSTKETLSKAARVLGGGNAEDDKPKLDPHTERLLRDTKGTLLDVIDIAKEQLRDELAQKEKFVALHQEAVKKYPGLEEHKDVIEAKIEKHFKAGKSIEEATKLGHEDAAKALKIEAVDEKVRRRQELFAGIPSGGNSRGGSSDKSVNPKSEAGQQAYIQNLRKSSPILKFKAGRSRE